MTPRPVTPADIPSLSALHALCFDEAWSVDAIHGVLAMPGAFGLMVGDMSVLEGFVLARVGGGEAEILTICVTPERRGAGCGRALLSAATAHAIAAGAATMFLEVAEDNSEAIRLYESFGFYLVGIRPGYYKRPDGRMAAHTLRLDLPASQSCHKPLIL